MRTNLLRIRYAQISLLMTKGLAPPYTGCSGTLQQGQLSNSPIKDLGVQILQEYDLLSPRRSWQALLPGVDKPHNSRASTSPSSPGGLDKRLAYPSASRQIATAETCSLLVYLALKGTAPCHPPTRPQARIITTRAAIARGQQQRDEQGGRS